MKNVAQPETIVRNHVIWSTAAGLIPIPIADLAAVTAVQLDMLKQLCEHYEVDYSAQNGKIWVSALTGSVLARIGAGAIKMIPGIGSLIGGVSMAALSGASTYAVGKVFIRHFETGGDLFNFDADAYREYYEAEFEEGKEVAREAEKSN